MSFAVASRWEDFAQPAKSKQASGKCGYPPGYIVVETCLASQRHSFSRVVLIVSKTNTILAGEKSRHMRDGSGEAVRIAAFEAMQKMMADQIREATSLYGTNVIPLEGPSPASLN